MRVSFRPARDGYAFTNGFTNHIKIAGLPITDTKGRCGGMAFAALDHWHQRLRPGPARSIWPTPAGRPTSPAGMAAPNAGREPRVSRTAVGVRA